MNFEKGIQRVFVVLAIAWAAICVGGFAVFAIHPHIPVREEDVITVIATIVVPIGGGYVLCFFAIPWIARAFRHRG
jgi:uncharacterized membrane protein YadS